MQSKYFLSFLLLLISVGLSFAQIPLAEDIDCTPRIMSYSKDGSTLVIADLNAGVRDASFNATGEVKAFRLSGNTWTQVGQTIVGPEGGQLGLDAKLSADGDRLVVVGERLTTLTDRSRRGVIVYDLSNGQWTQKGQTILTEQGDFSFFPYVGISADGSRIAVSFDAVKILELNAGQWVQRGNDLIGFDLPGFGSPGRNIDMSPNGDCVVIGNEFINSPTISSAGAVVVNKWSGTQYEKVGQELQGTLPFGAFGENVAISTDGNTIAVGGASSSIMQGGGFRDPGSVTAYTFDGNSWVQKGQTLSGNGDLFGEALAMNDDGTFIAVTELRGSGVNEEGCTFLEGGSVSLFQFQNNTWQNSGITMGGNGLADRDGFGLALGMSGNGQNLAVMANLGSECITPLNRGYIKTFDLTQTPIIPEPVSCSTSTPTALCDLLNNTTIPLNECTSFCFDPGELFVFQGINMPPEISANILNDCGNLNADISNSFEVSGPGASLEICPTTGGTFTLFILFEDGDSNCQVTIQGPLPVTYLFFEAKAADKQVNLEWETTEETDNQGFDVQRSTDGLNWQTIGFVSSNEPNLPAAYTFQDNNPTIGINYYRLEQLDYDGSSKFSPVVSVNFSANDGLLLYPNPANEILNITAQNMQTITILDVYGRKVRTCSVSSGTSTFDITSLRPGFYFIAEEKGKSHPFYKR